MSSLLWTAVLVLCEWPRVGFITRSARGLYGEGGFCSKFGLSTGQNHRTLGSWYAKGDSNRVWMSESSFSRFLLVWHLKSCRTSKLKNLCRSCLINVGYFFSQFMPFVHLQWYLMRSFRWSRLQLEPLATLTLALEPLASSRNPQK